MKKFKILFEAGMTGPKEIAEAHLDLVMEFLVDKGVEDPWIGLGPEKVEITLALTAETPEEALALATQLILDAIQAAGAKPAPPAVAENLGFQLQKVELVPTQRKSLMVADERLIVRSIVRS